MRHLNKLNLSLYLRSYTLHCMTGLGNKDCRCGGESHDFEEQKEAMLPLAYVQCYTDIPSWVAFQYLCLFLYFSCLLFIYNCQIVSTPKIQVKPGTFSS